MKEQRNISRHLAGAAGAVAAGLGGAQSLDAAVLATTLEAEIPPTFVVDLDGDGFKEFEFGDTHSEPTPEDPNIVLEDTIKITAFPEGGGVGVALDLENYAAKLSGGTLIGPSLTYGAPPGETDDLSGVKGGVAVGNFQVEDGPGYIGVSFPIAGATHYGYVGYQGVETDELNAGPEGRVFGFGYESVPDTAIAAGAGLPLSADIDQDDDVDGNDFLLIQRDIGGAYDADDIAAFKEQFGQGGSVAPAVGAVPEPSSLAMLAAGAAGVALFRRRRSSDAT